MKKNYKERIFLLQKRVIEHQATINQLLSNQQQLRQTYEHEQKIPISNRSSLSNASDLHKQVNLLSNIQSTHRLSFKKKNRISQISNSVSQYNLHDSLMEIYGDVKIYTTLPEDNESNIEVEGEGDFNGLIEYISENELWQNLMKKETSRQGKEQYKVNMFMSGESVCTNISHHPLLEEEEGLILSEDNNIYIPYLLLYRAIDGCMRQMSLMLNRLFGYPLQSFYTNNSSQMLDFFSKVVNISEEELQQKVFYGLNRTTLKEDILNINDNCTQINGYKVSDINHYYQKITIIHWESDLLSKNIILKHHQNHYVIANLNVRGTGIQYIAAQEFQEDSETIFWIVLLDSSKNIVSYKKVHNRQSIETFLSEGQYTIYISCRTKNPKFTLWIQSSNECQFELRFLPQYNRFTQTIIQSYLSGLPEIVISTQPSVVRCKLKVLDFSVDIFNVGKEQIQVQYGGTNILCDENYKKTKTKAIYNPKNGYSFIYLNGYAEIVKNSKEMITKHAYL